jgi:hypothetical protein
VRMSADSCAPRGSQYDPPGQNNGSMPEDYESLYRQGLVKRLDSLEQAVREAISRFDNHNSELTKGLNELRIQVGVIETTLKIKAGIWGSLAGMAAGIGMVLLLILSRAAH